MLPEDAVDKRATHALQLTHLRGARIRDLSVRWSAEAPEPKWQSALVLRDVADFSIDGFAGRPGGRDTAHPAVLLDGTTGGTLQNGETDCARRQQMSLPIQWSA